MAGEKPYEAEVRLLRWGDSSTAGRTITLELPPDAGEVHPFKGFPVGAKYGQRFLMRFDVILDDETTPTATDSVEAPARTTSKVVDADRSEKAKAQYAAKTAMEKDLTRSALLCQDLAFQVWLAKKLGHGQNWKNVDREETTAANLRKALGIESRTEIGYDPVVNKAFLRLETQYRSDTNQMAEVRS